jgi:hypothetical protein
MSALSAGSLPPINPASEPASVRNGPAAAKQAYQEALGFEQLLVSQLSQQLAATVSSPGGDGSSDGSSDSSSDGSSDSGGGILGSDPGTSGFAGMIPQALTSGIMSSGGTGIALQLAKALDPALGQPTPKRAAGS